MSKSSRAVWAVGFGMTLAGLVLVWGGVQAAPAPVAGTGPAAASPAAVPATEAEPPDDLRVLRLTDAQRKILDRTFQRHPFENPPPPKDDAEIGVKVEPTVPGGLYRMGPGGDLPVRVAVTVRVVGGPAKVALRYSVEDFYGRKAGEGVLPAAFTDAGGMVATELVLKDLASFGYYHVVVTAAADDRLAMGSGGLAVVHPRAETGDAAEPFGLTAPPGRVSADLVEAARRLGAAHVAFPTAFGPAAGPESAEHFLALGTFNDRLAPGTTLAAAPGTEAGRLSAQLGISGYQFLRGSRLPSRAAGAAYAKAAAEYRFNVKDVLLAAEAEKAPMFVAADLEGLVDILTEGPVLKGAEGLGLCLDAGAGAPNLRSGAFRRSVDYARQIAGKMGIKHLYVTETGESSAAFSPQQQAWKLVTRHVLALAAGAERVYVAAGCGVPAPLPSAAAYAWMTHHLRAARYAGAVWPDVPLLEGHVFAGGGRSVAVAWSWVGEDPAAPDRGALVLENGARLEVCDVVGNPVGIWKGERLIVPLGEAPVYLSSAELSADQLRDRLRGAKILGLAPATAWLRSLTPGSSPDRLTATLWVQSHRPQGCDAVAGIKAPDGWKVRPDRERFSLGSGQAKELTFDLERIAPAPGEAAASAPAPELATALLLGEEWMRRTQVPLLTQTPERTVDVGYGLEDWKGIEPVRVANETGAVRAEVRTAWDAKFFYFAAAVYRDRDSYIRGRTAADGDAIQLAWGLDDRADDDFGNRGRERAFPAGAFRDTDHLMAITFGKDGPQVLRLRGPHILLRDHVAGNQDSWFGPVEGAAADISRDLDGKVTLYEAAIPLKALAPLKAERGRTFRFSFRIGDAARAPLEGARAAGVPDFLAGPGSFLPLSSLEGLPCQMTWKFTGPAKEEKAPEKK
jgi:hypothetical protein